MDSILIGRFIVNRSVESMNPESTPNRMLLDVSMNPDTTTNRMLLDVSMNPDTTPNRMLLDVSVFLKKRKEKKDTTNM
jgi:hypothetical protein